MLLKAQVRVEHALVRRKQRHLAKPGAETAFSGRIDRDLRHAHAVHHRRQRFRGLDPLREARANHHDQLVLVQHWANASVVVGFNHEPRVGLAIRSQLHQRAVTADREERRRGEHDEHAVIFVQRQRQIIDRGGGRIVGQSAAGDRHLVGVEVVKSHCIAKKLAVAGRLGISIGRSEARGIKRDSERGYGSLQHRRELLVHGGIVRAVRADRGVHSSHIELLASDCADCGAQGTISERSAQQELSIDFVSSDSTLCSRLEVGRTSRAVSWDLLEADDAVLLERSQNFLGRGAGHQSRVVEGRHLELRRFGRRGRGRGEQTEQDREWLEDVHHCRVELRKTGA